MKDEDYSTFYISDHLKRAIPKLVYMHVFCGVAQFLGLYSSSTNKKSFIHNVLNMMTVPLYQFSILQSYYELVQAEYLARAMHCGGIAFAQKRYWIYVEIMGFFVNII
jgi:hypothetical protein